MESSASTSPERPVRVFVVNDSPIFLEALRRFFLLEPWIEQVGSGVMTPDIFQAVAEAQPDVIILEPGSQRSHLAEVIRQFRARLPAIHVLVLTLAPGAHNDDAGLHLNAVTPDVALAAGADGFVAKENTAEDLLDAIRRLARQT